MYDVAIVGAGPAGLSAALLLARCLRRVVVLDSGNPRNLAARQVNGYLGADALSPAEFRARGRRQAEGFGVEFRDEEVHTAARQPQGDFLLVTPSGSLSARKLLLATGVRDHLPEIDNVGRFYGSSIHHCPYCDGWEHRGKRLLALGEGDAVVNLALLLRGWSKDVWACCEAKLPCPPQLARLTDNNIPLRRERPQSVQGDANKLTSVTFDSGPPLSCDAIFFSSSQEQRSPLAEMLGCQTSSKNQTGTNRKQGSSIPGLFLAGDIDGEVQLAIVAAAEGAVAATAINRELQEEASEC